MSTLDGNYVLGAAAPDDLAAWMAMVAVVRDEFPGLDTAEALESYGATVRKNIGRGTALCVKHDAQVVGVLLFSYHSHCLSCLAVHPDHRRRGIASALIEGMLALYPPDEDLSVTTFRADDPKGTAPRALYRRFGFEPGELLTEFGYPHQRFVLHRA